MDTDTNNLPDDVLSVWLLTILNRYGTELYIFREEAVARQQLFDYVKDSWPTKYPDDMMPDEPGEAIRWYFDLNERESYILVNQRVLETPEWA